MIRSRFLASLLLLSAGCDLGDIEVNNSGRGGSLTIENIAAIRHPSDAAWSPDGNRIAFLWDSAGNQNLFVVTPGDEPVALTRFEPDEADLVGDIGDFEWVSDETILFARDGKLWTIASSGGEPAELPGSDEAGAFALSHDRTRIAFVRDGQLSVVSVGGSRASSLTEFEEPLRAASPVFSPDGRYLAFTASRIESVSDVLPYNGNKQALFRRELSDFRVGIVPTTGGATRWIEIDGRPSYVQWAGSDSVLFQRISPDMKTREIHVASLNGQDEHTRLLRTDHDDRWWSPLRRDARTVVSPHGELVAFFADESGYSHLYVLPTDGSVPGSEARQLTSGAFEAGFGSWSEDSQQIAFYDNDQSAMERFIRMVDVESGAIRPVVTQAGVSFWPRLSPDGEKIVYEHTDVENSVDLYVASTGQENDITRLTHSMPSDINPSDLTTPVAVEFPSRVDGQAVPASLFVPDGLDESKQHAAIIWIHGSGSDQNFLGWHPFSYRMYYSANQYLAQQGYIILAVDYRGSSGYGRDWGTGHHLDLGGPDALDVASGADYLKTLDYVDPDRIGVWGLSYGGFLTLQTLIHTPKLFACGIDVAGVTDWTTWGLESNGGWITGRMDTPENNPEGYDRTAPIKHMETLERPLLILHGTADVNVAFRESLNLIDVLLKMGKDFDFEAYPGELHFFRREHILRDAWRRSERFFDEHLRPELTSARSD